MKKLLKKLLKSIFIAILMFLVNLFNSPNLVLAESVTDSFADTSKINTGASSGYTVSGGQLKASSSIKDWWKMDEASGNSIADSAGSNTATAYTSPPIGWWKMNEDAGANVADFSGNGLNGTNNGTGPSVATGGTITYSGGYTIHTFTSSGTFTSSFSSGNVEYLVVAGGGGGSLGGGGGGGGMLTGTTSVTSGNYPVVVGLGGAGSYLNTAQPGGNSSFNAITATGGGYGGGNTSAHCDNGGPGGSGGGSGMNSGGEVCYGGAGTGGQGHNGGGTPGVACSPSGGGGGAGGVGATPYTGGIGLQSYISGSAVYYAGGGGGGSYCASYGAGGAGGGGAGAIYAPAGNGTANTGGGGGGGYPGGNGGSGIVIVRYPTPWNVAAGQYGNARSFNGTSDYISVPNHSSLNISDNLSIDFWFKANADVVGYASQPIIKASSTTDANYVFYYFGTTSGANRYITFYANAGGAWANIAGWYLVTVGQWYHVALVYNSSSGGTLYVNGQVVGSPAGSGALATNGQPLVFGGTGFGSYFPGVLDDVRIYNYALSQAGIQSDMNNYQYLQSEIPASGGTITYSGGNTIHTFTSSGRSVFFYTGADQTYIVPDGVTSITVKMWGGGGGGGNAGGWTYGFAGGGGGYTTGTLAVTPGQVLTVMVGAGGSNGSIANTANSYGGGGLTCGGTDCRYGGQGGGRSALRISGVEYLTAGGGGGGGSSRAANGQQGGAGGGSTGANGTSYTQSCAGSGGGQASGGAGGSCPSYPGTAGVQSTGGHPASPYSYGGGGGGGWYGGGAGGYQESNDMGGGGGGSGYIGGTGVTNATTTAGSGVTPANATDIDNGRAGTGGAASTNGIPGKVIIAPVQNQTFTCASSGNVEVLVVGGGGGGGMDMGGGGGGGGVIYNPAYACTANNPIAVTVGAGGFGGPAAGTNGQPEAHQYILSATNGQNSVFGSLTAVGGGFGGSSYRAYTPGIAGGNGGSGGGSSGYNDNAGTFYGGTGTSGQGYRGGNSSTAYYSGGGGGAGGAGADSTNQANGGVGYLSSINGTSLYWGGGGGGAGYSIGGGNGGAGGGGGGAAGTTTGGSGLNSGQAGGGGCTVCWTNTQGGNGGASTGGGGGGGGHYNANNKGGDGGSGIVIVRYPTSYSTNSYIVAGNYGNARSFDGGHDYATGSSPTNLPTGSVMTAEAWVYPKGYTAHPTYNGIVGWGSRSNNDTFSMSVKNDGKLSFAAWANDQYQTAGSALTLNAWNHVAIVLSGTTVQFYLGGALQDTKTLTQTPNVTSAALWFGTTWGNGSMFQGYIDDVRIYSTALTQPQIANDMNNGTNYSTTSTIVSTNLLTGVSEVDGIDEFVYNLSSKPEGSTATVQFSQNGTTWVNSANQAGGTDTLTTGTNNTINIHALGWSGANFYYKVALTNNGINTPVLDDVNVNYTISGYTNSSTGATDPYSDTTKINTGSSSGYAVSAGTLNMGLPSGYWKMDEASGMAVADSSGNGNNGTMYQIAATGGTITYSGGYTIHTFTTSGTLVVQGPGNFEYLVVGGGGGGGNYNGGGAGGVVRTGTVALTVGNKTVTVGGPSQASVMDSITAPAGGGSAGYSGGSNADYSGGYGGDWSWTGGGAGAGQNGNPGYWDNYGGDGGTGAYSAISGTGTYYGGGGGGQGYVSGGNGGAGGGGYGGDSGGAGHNGSDGTPNTGGGGGGGHEGTTSGGSGIVIVRYPTPSNSIVAGKYGNARNFNGTSEYIDIPNSAVFDVANLTIEAWVYSTNFNQSGFIFEKGPVNTQYSCFFNGNDVFYFRTLNSAAVMDDLTFTTSSYFTNSAWNHVACVFNGSTKSVYVNGNPTASKSWVQTLRTGQTGERIGAYGGGAPAYFFNGKIDDVRIYNHARTQAQIQNDMNNIPPTSATIQSINLLSGISGINSIDSFVYSLTSLPANTTATVQFSRDTSTWYNSSGVSGGTNSLSVGTNTISLSGLAWSGSYFFYKIAYTSDGNNSPSLDYITVNYTASTSTIGSTWAACIPQAGGDFTLSYNCYFPNTRFSPADTNVDGVDNGNVTIQAYKTLTIRGDQQIVRNNGKSITIQNGGSIAINDIPIGGNGGNVRDYSGNGNEGTPSMAWATTVVAGKYGTARSFNGSSDYINVGNGSSLPTSGDITLESWFKTSDTGNNNMIASYGTTGDWLYWFGKDDSNLFHCKLYQTNSGSAYLEVASSMTVNDNNWHHGACIVSGTTLSLYVDGNPAGTTNSTAGTRDTSTAGNLYIGKFDYSIPYYFNGSLDDVRIYNYARTADQVALDKDYAPNPTGNGPVAWWRFEDGGQIKETNLWLKDENGDGWSQSYETQQRAQNDSPGTGWVRRNLTIGSAFGDGRDGNITFATNTNLNTYNHQGRSCADGGDAVTYSVSSLGSTTLPNGNPASTATLTGSVSTGCVNAGDHVLIINLQGTTANSTNVGNYELLKVYSVSGNTITFTSAKKKYYGNGATDDTNIGTATSNQRVMLQRVPQYGSVTVNIGVTVTGTAWNGVKGGVLAFKAKETVTINGYIDASGNGYQGGGSVNGDGDGYGGMGGESFCGTGGLGSAAGAGGNGAAGGGSSASGNGGNGSCGGGGGSYNATGGTGSAAAGGAGGAGGGHGAGAGAGYGTFGYGGVSGGANGGTNSSGNGGTSAGGGGGGGTYGNADLTTKLMLGSGGGSGSAWYVGNTSGQGGRGGGSVLIFANSLTVSGQISSNGQNGSSSNCPAGGYAGAGGGGAGGSILISGGSLTLGTNIILASNGLGAVGCANGAPGTYNSGAGGSGRVAVGGSTVTGTTNPTYTAITAP